MKNIIEKLGIEKIERIETYSLQEGCVQTPVFVVSQRDLSEVERQSNMSLAILIDTMIWYDLHLIEDDYTKEVKAQIRWQIEARYPQKRPWKEIKALLNAKDY